MAVTFASTTGRPYDPVVVTVSALSASTAYYATFGAASTSTGNAHRIDFTTDGAGAASLTYVPTGRSLNGVVCNIFLKTPVATATSSNTLTVV